MAPPTYPALDRLTTIDWEQPGSILDGCTPLFDAVTHDPQLLLPMLDHAAADPHLASMCERYDFLDKLVLQDLPDIGVRVRLHLYRSGYFDRPHNHRWSFASHIVAGQYRHLIFGRDDHFDETVDPATLVPIHERIEYPGDHYTLHHSSVHTVQAQEDTISLLVRGPAAKDRFLIVDRETGGFFWVYGAANETPQQRDAKRMTPAALGQTITRLRSLIGAQSTVTAP